MYAKKSEFYNVIRAINPNNLDDKDKEELLKIFMVTENILIRDQISFIFSDVHYNIAIPFILKKILNESNYNNNGSLVFALDNLDAKKYFFSFIKIICVQGYEARLMAYDMVEKYANSISNRTKSLALRKLERYRINEKSTATEKGENSRLHFIEQTIKLLKGK